MKKIILTFVSTLSVAGFALVEVADGGGNSVQSNNVGTHQYGDSLNPLAIVTKSIHNLWKSKNTLQDLGTDKYPFNNAGWSYGQINKIKLKHTMPKALFVMGSSSGSVAWLVENEASFKKVNAFGCLANGTNPKVTERMIDTTHLMIKPCDLTGFSDYIPTRKYPFLIYKDSLIQSNKDIEDAVNTKN